MVSKGTGKSFVEKLKGHPDPQNVHQPKYIGKKWHSKSNTTCSQKGARSQDETEVHMIILSNQSPAHDAFTTLRTRHYNPNVEGPLRIKVETGAGGNILTNHTD